MKPNGGLAFPTFGPTVTGIDSDGQERIDVEASGGATLRDYFAAHAPEMPLWFQDGADYQASMEKKIARRVAWAFAYADSMLVERAK